MNFVQHYIVVGAGLAGLKVAARLVQANVRVTLLDRTALSPAGGTSGGWVVIDPTTAPTPQLKALIAGSRERLRRAPGYYGEVLRPGGVLHVAASHEEFSRLGDLSIEADRLDVDHERLGMDVLHDRFPELEPDAARGAILLDPLSTPEIITSSLYQGARKLFINRGGEMRRETELLAADRVGGVWRVETNAGILTCDVLVNAAGAEIEAVAARCGVTSQRLVTRRRSVVVSALDPEAGSAAPAARSPLICWSGTDGLVLRTEPYNELWTSGAEDPLTAHHAPSTEQIEVAGLMERVQDCTRYRPRGRLRSWAGATVAREAGVAPSGLAGEPLISWDNRVVDFFWFGGFGRHGVQAAAAAADVAADLLLRRRGERFLYEDCGVKPRAFAVAAA